MSEDEAKPEVETPVADDDATQTVKDLLAEHVPLALLVDLVRPESTSTEILEAEGLPDVAWWDPDGGPTAPETPTEAGGDPEP